MKKYKNTMKKFSETDVAVEDQTAVMDKGVEVVVDHCTSKYSTIAKLVAGATVSAGGAAACYMHIQKVMENASKSRPDLNLSYRGWSAVKDFFKVSTKNMEQGVWIKKDPLSNVIRALYASITKAMDWAVKAINALLSAGGSAIRGLASAGNTVTSKIPFLNRPIMKTVQSKLGTAAWYEKAASNYTYGAVLFCALIASAVVAVIYKVYKIIKNRRNAGVVTESQRIDQSIAILMACKESNRLFNRLNKLTRLTEDGEVGLLSRAGSALSGLWSSITAEDAFIMKSWRWVSGMFSDLGTLMSNNKILSAIIIVATMLIACWVGFRKYAKNASESEYSGYEY